MRTGREKDREADREATREAEREAEREVIRQADRETGREAGGRVTDNGRIPRTRRTHPVAHAATKHAPTGAAPGFAQEANARFTTAPTATMPHVGRG